MIRDVRPFLCSDRKVQKVFSPPPIVSHRIARKIKYIVRLSSILLKGRQGAEGVVVLGVKFVRA